MHVSVKCYATLNHLQPENNEAFPIEPGETVASLMAKLSISPEDVHIRFVNSKHVDVDTKLKDGDKVGLFPAVGGG